MFFLEGFLPLYIETWSYFLLSWIHLFLIFSQFATNKKKKNLKYLILSDFNDLDTRWICLGFETNYFVKYTYPSVWMFPLYEKAHLRIVSKVSRVTSGNISTALSFPIKGFKLAWKNKIIVIKIKTKYHTVGTDPKFNRKIVCDNKELKLTFRVLRNHKVSTKCIWITRYSQ